MSRALTSNATPQTLINTGQSFSLNQLNVIDSLSYRIGSQHFKFGADYRRLTSAVAFVTYNLKIILSSRQQAINAIADSGSIAARIATKPIFVNYSAYGQDTWRVSRRLTHDLRLRWDVHPASGESSGKRLPARTQITNLATMQLAAPSTPSWKTTCDTFPENWTE